MFRTVTFPFRSDFNIYNALNINLDYIQSYTSPIYREGLSILLKITSKLPKCS